MKRLRDGSIIALSMMVLLGMIGCGSEQAATVKRDEPAYREPPKAEGAKVTIVQEDSVDRSDSVASDLKRIEQKSDERSPNDKCETDADCVVIPTNLDGCLPCLGEGSKQEPENKDSAIEIMSKFKEKCRPVLEELKSGKGNPVRSTDATCEFNGAKCVDGMCELANIKMDGQGGSQVAQPSQSPSSVRGRESGRYQEANGQGPAGGRDRYNSLNQQNFGLDRNGLQKPQGYDSQFNYPGRSPGLTQDDYGHQSRWPQAGASGNSRYGNSDGPTLPQGYNQQRSYPGQPGAGQQGGYGQQGRWPQGNGAANFSQANGRQGNSLGRSDFGLNQGNGRGAFGGSQANGRGQNFGAQGNSLGRSDFGLNQGNGRGAFGAQGGRGQNFGAQGNSLGRSDFGLNQGNARGAGGGWPQGNSLGSGFNQGAGGRGNMGLPQNGRGAGFGQGQNQFPQGYGNRQQYPGR